MFKSQDTGVVRRFLVVYWRASRVDLFFDLAHLGVVGASGAELFVGRREQAFLDSFQKFARMLSMSATAAGFDPGSARHGKVRTQS